MGILEEMRDEQKAIHAALKAIHAAVTATPPPVEPPVIPPPTETNATVVDLILHEAVNVAPGAKEIRAKFSGSGLFYLWVEGVFPSFNADSFYVSVNGELDTIFDAAEGRWGPNPQWTILNKRTNGAVDQTPRKIVAAGSNVILFKVREDGAVIRRLFLAAIDGGQMPSGATMPVIPSPPVAPPIAPPIEVPTEGDVYVAPNADGSGGGTRDKPWTITQALTAPIAPGKTVYMLGGNYKGSVVCKLIGTPSSRIRVVGMPGERATIMGKLFSRGQYVDFENLEVTGPNSQRVSQYKQSYTPPDLRAAGVDCQHDDSVTVLPGNNRFIHMVIHDCCDNGIGLWRTQPGNEVYGCLIFYNGWLAPDRAHGHGVYTQNLRNNGDFSIRDNHIFNNFVYGLQVYGEGDFVNGYNIDGCVFFGSGAPSRLAAGGLQPNAIIGAAFPSRKIRFNNNISDGYGAINLGYAGNPQTRHEDLAMANNHLYSGLEFTNWAKITGGMNFATTVVYAHDGSSRAPGVTIGAPAELLLFVRSSEFARRFNVTIVNPQSLGQVAVPVPMLQIGEKYRVRDVQNFFAAPVAEGAYDGAVKIPMVGLKAAQPIGAGLAQVAHTAPKFGTFIVEAV